MFAVCVVCSLVFGAQTLDGLQQTSSLGLRLWQMIKASSLKVNDLVWHRHTQRMNDICAGKGRDSIVIYDLNVSLPIDV